MDIFWNYTIHKKIDRNLHLMNQNSKLLTSDKHALMKITMLRPGRAGGKANSNTNLADTTSDLTAWRCEHDTLIEPSLLLMNLFDESKLKITN